MEHKLEQRLPRDASAFHVIDAGDVEEVIFVVVRQISFHLLWIHAAIRLGHIDHRIADLRKYIHWHSLKRQHGSKRNRDERNDNSQWTTKCKQYESHISLPFSCSGGLFLR